MTGRGVDDAGGRARSPRAARGPRGAGLGLAFAGAFAAGVLAFAARSAAPPERPLRVALVLSDPAVLPFARALDRLARTDPDVAAGLDVTLRAAGLGSAAEADLPAARPAAPGERAPATLAPGADVVLVELLEARWVEAHGAWLEALRAGHEAPASPADPRLLALGPPGRGLDPARLEQLGLDAQDPAIEAHWRDGGPEAAEQVLRRLLALAGRSVAVAPPTPAPPAGLVRFDADGTPRLHASWASWEVAGPASPSRAGAAQAPARAGPGPTWSPEAASAATRGAAARPRVAVLEFPARARRGTLALAHALDRALALRGLEAVVVYGQPGSAAVRALLLDEAGRPRVEAVVSLHLKFTDADAAAALAALDVPVLNALRVYGRTVDQWRASTQGLTTGEVAWQLAVPELSGLGPHQVVGALASTREGLGAAPIAERVARAADRVAAWVRLRATPPAARRLALLYWNYPPGKQNVGASYLNVVRSIPEVLRELARRGVDVGPLPRDPALARGWAAALEAEVVARGRNVARWAPGELARLVAAGDAVLVPLSTYRAWWAALPAGFRRDVEAHWGPPEAAEIMVWRGGAEPSFVLPVVRRGNVALLVQPDRARTQDLDALYQSQSLPPHHQYVAAYLWLQRGFDAHAAIHLGTHGTHEWLSGKESGPSGDDPGEVLAGHLPIVYPYIVDDVGEGIVAKRRGAAVVVDHLTPALGEAGLAPELADLRDRLRAWRQRASTGAGAGPADPDGAEAGADDDPAGPAAIEALARTRGLHVDLRDRGWDPPRGSAADRLAALEDHLEELAGRTIPLGLHTFGVSPAGARLDEMTALVLAPRRAGPPGAATRADLAALASSVAAALTASGPAEHDGLWTGLSGRFVRPGPGNDPVRDPAAVPTGKNFFAFDPRSVPTPEAERLGALLAERLVRRLAGAGRWPRKVALQLWGVETIRHQGVQEAQALALLGVRLERDAQGRPRGLALVPRAALGRPRVDVVLHATSLYRDTFPMLLELLDRAVSLAADAPEDDNPLRAHVADLAAALEAEGVAPAEARRRARVRAFAEPTGHHDSKIGALASASGSWETDAQVADTWIRRMGHGYGQGLWGPPMEAELRHALAGTEAIVHTRASQLYATLDNDDYFSYGGSIALGVRRVQGGASPPFLVTDLRRPGAEEHVTLERFMGQELRSRHLNPRFVTNLVAEGYAGARDVWKAVEYLWGWQVVYPEAVSGEAWQELHDVWLRDRYALGLAAFFAEHNPHARQGIAGRMLETIRKGFWSPDAATRDGLVATYVAEVATHDVACDHLTCDDPALQAFVGDALEAARAAGTPLVPDDVAARWRENVERATGTTLAAALARRQADLARWHGAPGRAPEGSATDRPAGGASAGEPGAEPVRGWVLEAAPLAAADPEAGEAGPGAPDDGATRARGAGLALALLACAGGLRERRRLGAPAHRRRAGHPGPIALGAAAR